MGHCRWATLGSLVPCLWTRGRPAHAGGWTRSGQGGAWLLVERKDSDGRASLCGSHHRGGREGLGLLPWSEQELRELYPLPRISQHGRLSALQQAPLSFGISSLGGPSLPRSVAPRPFTPVCAHASRAARGMPAGAGLPGDPPSPSPPSSLTSKGSLPAGTHLVVWAAFRH